MVHTRRITVITPEFSSAIMNQEVKVSSKIKAMGLMGAGNCSYVCKFEKDVLYPNDSIRMSVDIDNTKCSKKIEKYKIKLLRRTQVFNAKNSKPIYTNDQVLISEKSTGECAPKSTEKKDFVFQIPKSIFVDDAEEERIKVPLPEKALAMGPSSSLSGKLYKV